MLFKSFARVTVVTVSDGLTCSAMFKLIDLLWVPSYRASSTDAEGLRWAPRSWGTETSASS